MNNQIIFQRYQILNKLGEGGFGTTYLAEDLQMPSRRRCVVKQLKPLTQDPQIYQVIKDRFQKEAAILEQLSSNSRQIPQLYAYFEDQGQFYLVQEFIDGDTLSSLMTQKGSLDEHTVKEILLKLLPVLEYVHNHRIVHRDIKPDNIIIRRSDNTPVLIDFGAVKESMGTVMTPTGSPTNSIVIGTPGFMPSEQSAGRPVYATDLYALGLTAIYLLTGKTPQELETDPLSGEIIWKQYAPKINPNLGKVLDKAIKSFHKERFSTAREMREAIELQPSTAETVVVSPATQVTPVSEPKSNWLKNGLIGGLIAIPIALAVGFYMLQPQDSGKVNHDFIQPETPTIPEEPTPDEPEPDRQNNQNQFALVQFPQSSCGDPLPTDSSLYPVNFYPVFLKYSPDNLNTIKTNFCQDAFGTIRKDTREQAIQIASFTSLEKAREFSEFMQDKVGSGEVGQATQILQPPDQQVENTQPDPSPQTDEGQNLDESQARETLENFYNLVSEKQYSQANELFSPELSAEFDPNFFNQFERVTVENLQITFRNDSMIDFMGENTYVYFDGSTQRELRSYTVSNINGKPTITASKFNKVIQMRE